MWRREINDRSHKKGWAIHWNWFIYFFSCYFSVKTHLGPFGGSLQVSILLCYGFLSLFLWCVLSYFVQIVKEYIVEKRPEMTPHEERATDLHSLVNILNICCLQLTRLGMDLPPKYEKIITSLENEWCAVAEKLQDASAIGPHLIEVRNVEKRIFEALRRLIAEAKDKEELFQIKLALDNFDSISPILNTCLDEIWEIDDDAPDLWIEISVKNFTKKIKKLFRAIEKNAKGRYFIRFDLAQKLAGDYYIDLNIETEDESEILWIPKRLQDVVRDLLANARKYTNPGGRVALMLYQNKDSIECTINDNGCGIPESEIEHVTEFGYRASNVRSRRTMGGGFGLTKAACLVLGWGGSFSISSGENEGTTLKISVPNQPRLSV